MTSLRILFAVFIVFAFFGLAESALMRGPAWWSRTIADQMNSEDSEEANEVRQSRIISQELVDRAWKLKWLESLNKILKSMPKDGQQDITLNTLLSSIFGRIL